MISHWDHSCIVSKQNTLAWSGLQHKQLLILEWTWCCGEICTTCGFFLPISLNVALLVSCCQKRQFVLRVTKLYNWRYCVCDTSSCITCTWQRKNRQLMWYKTINNFSLKLLKSRLAQLSCNGSCWSNEAWKNYDLLCIKIGLVKTLYPLVNTCSINL